MKHVTWVLLISTLLLVGCSSESSNTVTEESTKKVTQKSTNGGNDMTNQSANLIEAVEKNNVAQVKELLNDSSVAIDATNSKKETPLLIATHNNDVEIAKLLIDAGADVNKQDAIEDSPYLYAGAQGKTEILQYMMEHAKPNQSIYNRFGGNTIIPAAEKGHLETVKLLVTDEQVDINHQNNFGYTALIEAVALTNGSEVFQEIVKVLLENGADKQLKDNSGRSALDYAKKQGYTEMIKMLEK